jgi:phenylalanyl-tRNA synthetase alpha chain
MLNKIIELRTLVEAESVSTQEELEAFRIKYLSKKGLVSLFFEDFRNVPADQKKEVGEKLNILKNNILQKYNLLKDSIINLKEESTINDLTRPAFPFSAGSRHPISIIRNEIIEIFMRIGFVVSEGPEIEDDDRVFTKLNFAPEHPARDMQDTFYISRTSGEDSSPDDILLRTQTSSVQVRVMQNEKPPIRTISPGRVFRNEVISARAHCIFHQVEGLYIDENVVCRFKTDLAFFCQRDVW